MHSPLRRSLMIAACCFISGEVGFSETIIKLDLGPIGPDIKLESGMLSTVDDGNGSAESPGEQDTSVAFDNFAKDVAGIANIFPPETASFTLSGVGVIGVPLVVDQGSHDLVVQSTSGGSFSLFDEAGAELLTGTLEAGSLHGHTGISGTSSFLTASLGTFTGPMGTALYDVLDPGSASLAISLTDVLSSGTPGLEVVNDVIQDFSADATANIGAEPIPEPTSMILLGLGLAFLGRLHRRR